jgi:hypothetical protein
MIFTKKKEVYTGQNIVLKDGVEISPGIFVYEDVIDNSQELIDFAVSDPEKWRDSRVGYGQAEGVVNKEIRNTKILDVPAIFSNDIKWFEVSQIVWSYANKYGMDHDAAFSNMESLQLLHYSTDEGFYKPHADSGPGMQRIFSAVLYLNDVENGGETYFNSFDVSVSPKAGRLVMFPANFVYKHEARTPKSNDKFALVTWFNPVL